MYVSSAAKHQGRKIAVRDRSGRITRTESQEQTTLADAAVSDKEKLEEEVAATACENKVSELAELAPGAGWASSSLVKRLASGGRTHYSDILLIFFTS